MQAAVEMSSFHKIRHEAKPPLNPLEVFDDLLLRLIWDVAEETARRGSKEVGFSFFPFLYCFIALFLPIFLLSSLDFRNKGRTMAPRHR